MRLYFCTIPAEIARSAYTHTELTQGHGLVATRTLDLRKVGPCSLRRRQRYTREFNRSNSRITGRSPQLSGTVGAIEIAARGIWSLHLA